LAQRLAAGVSSPGELDLGVVCVPGFEAVTRGELESLGVAVTRAEPGMIECRGDLQTLYQLNLHLRTASRVLVRIGEFNAAAFSELDKKASRLPWRNYVSAGRRVAVRVTTQASKLYHKKGIAERVVKSISGAVGGEVLTAAVASEDGEKDVQLIVVRIIRNMCSISIDSSGEHLHRRGYKLEVGKAPLRENIAAAMLLASGWDRQSPLIDPFCGSGSIAIEAALMAAGIPPGAQRAFACESWPGWVSIPRVSIAPIKSSATIFGYDRDAGVVRSAQANAERAGVAGMVSFERRSISDLVLPDAPGWIVTNPPYGERIKGGPDLRNLYARFGTILRERAKGWSVCMVSASPRWTGQMNVKSEVVAGFNNGGLPVSVVKLSWQD
jgi:putative N6-adenine-specific DNA methylase